MFSWFRSLFSKPVPNQYAVLVRGIQVYETTNYADAEKYIRDSFNKADAQRLHSVLSVGRTTKRGRWQAYRSQCRVIRISG
jgi:hypothetical protein